MTVTTPMLMILLFLLAWPTVRSETCRETMKANGMNMTHFANAAAHGIHSLYLEEIRCQFHQRFTYNFYAGRSQKRKKILLSNYLFTLLGSMSVKAVSRTLMKLSPGFVSLQNNLLKSLSYRVYQGLWPS